MPTSSLLRSFAEDPGSFGAITPASGYERILNERYCLFLGPFASFTSISRLRLDPEQVPETIAEIRELVTARGHREAAWAVGSSATPGDLVDRLRVHGFVPADRPGWEAHVSSMVLTSEPPRGPGSVDVRRVETLEEYRLANRISGTAFGEPEEAVAERDAVAEERWAVEQEGHAPRTFLAFAGGEPVGVGRAIYEGGLPAVLLLGGAVLPHARGRGVYRALVRARWDEAVAAGTPALTIQAGAMSRPIVERLGFERVAEIEILLDPATC